MRSASMAASLAVVFLSSIHGAASQPSSLLKPGVAKLDSTSDYLVYYGSWNAEKIFRAKDFDLVILEPSNITPDQVFDLHKGHDGVEGTADDVLLIGYISVGEDYLGNRMGDGRGPCYWAWDSSRTVYENNGIASWYVDDANHDGAADQNSTWGSYYVNAADTAWWQFLKSNPNGADHTLVSLGLDGLFLDTIDSASPFSTWPYRWTTKGMSDLIGWLRQQYPGKILFANRGLFYFDPLYTTAYANTIRPYIDADMYESYYGDGSRAYWAGKVNSEAQKPDGFRVVALDYITPTDTARISAQMREVYGYNWADYISSSSLNEIRYEVYHRHAVDSNPPTWNTSIGLVGVTAGDQSVHLAWSKVTDQSQPMAFNVYVSSTQPFTIAGATKLAGVAAVFDTAAGSWQFTVGSLTNYTTYYFVVRAQDMVGNEDQNMIVLSATPPATSEVAITINGEFSDWANIPSLNQSPNPVESSGDVAEGSADISDVWVTNNMENLCLSYAVQTTFANASFFYHVFFDTDESAVTGYRYQDSAAVGAEFMVENAGLWKYTGTGGSNWSWSPAGGMALATSDGRLELTIPFSTLEVSPASGNGVRMLLQNNMAASPYSLIDVAPDGFANAFYRYGFLFTGIKGKDALDPTRAALMQSYPNPFNPTTQITYSIAQAGPTSLKVYNLLGQEVATLVDESKTPGVYYATFDARRRGGVSVASGVYYYRLVTGKSTLTRSMMLVK